MTRFIARGISHYGEILEEYELKAQTMDELEKEFTSLWESRKKNYEEFASFVAIDTNRDEDDYYWEEVMDMYQHCNRCGKLHVMGIDLYYGLSLDEFICEECMQNDPLYHFCEDCGKLIYGTDGDPLFHKVENEEDGTWYALCDSCFRKRNNG